MAATVDHRHGRAPNRGCAAPPGMSRAPSAHTQTRALTECRACDLPQPGCRSDRWQRRLFATKAPPGHRRLGERWCTTPDIRQHPVKACRLELIHRFTDAGTVVIESAGTVCQPDACRGVRLQQSFQTRLSLSSRTKPKAQGKRQNTAYGSKRHQSMKDATNNSSLMEFAAGFGKPLLP